MGDIVALADGFLGSAHAIPTRPTQTVPTAAGTVAAIGDGLERWTTLEMLATEHRLLGLVEASKGGQFGTVRPDDLKMALVGRPTIEAEQEAMVRQICTSGAGVDVIEGVAGSGKTFALAAAHDAWTASGYRVRGACLAARAAQRLEEGSGIRSTTLDRLLRSLATDPLTPADVIVIDEAGMVSTRALLRVVEQVKAARAKVVLVGDPCQLPELEAGGADALMVAANLSAVEDLNVRARRLLQGEGRLGPDLIRFGRRAFTTGDQVMGLRNDYRAGVLNGTRGVIEQIDLAARNLTLVAEDGTRLQVPFEYAAAGDLTHGYATTIHKAQGATVDRCFVLIEETTTREHAYTALSRGRHSNSLYVAVSKAEGDERHAPEVEPDPLDRLRQSLGRSIRQGLAIAALPPHPDPNAPEADIDDGHRLVGERSSGPHTQPLRPGRSAGQEPVRRQRAPADTGGPTCGGARPFLRAAPRRTGQPDARAYRRPRPAPRVYGTADAAPDVLGRSSSPGTASRRARNADSARLSSRGHNMPLPR